MSGLVKAKKYDWKDSNLALFGSDLEKNVKKESAEGEPAWEGAGKEVGVQVWRIVKFKVTHWPKQDYGHFYNGDSYIVLNTYKKDPSSEELSYDVHFWIGRFSSQDEYGTAAYKTVELDHFLDDKPVEHREVEGHESTLFKSYFDALITLKGGAETGFRRVNPEAYKPRLLHFCKKNKKIEVTEKSLKRANMNNGDVFIVDLGLTLYQWNGSRCSPDEKFSAAHFMDIIQSQRAGKPKTKTLDRQTVEYFNDKLAAVIPEGKPKKDKKPESKLEKVLSKLSDASGHLVFSEVSRGSAVKRSQLNTNDVFIMDSGDHCYVWSGKGSSVDERRRAMEFAHNYLMKSDSPFLPITCVVEGNETDDFNKAF
ncbi:gelsolin-like protein 1 [Nematostella vectensis]|uniref:gelsolin-like protein 1 n=1 Tax=Nematostella vectensis TaxID=45351 RepID=UPI0020779AFC|nr:gelsolin-like protein 1 [Nematostella vectensis]